YLQTEQDNALETHRSRCREPAMLPILTCGKTVREACSPPPTLTRNDPREVPETHNRTATTPWMQTADPIAATNNTDLLYTHSKQRTAKQNLTIPIPTCFAPAAP
ncbi:unnamed protein product, partial [Laminaria digitata]